MELDLYNPETEMFACIHRLEIPDIRERFSHHSELISEIPEIAHCNPATPEYHRINMGAIPRYWIYACLTHAMYNGSIYEYNQIVGVTEDEDLANSILSDSDELSGLDTLEI
jgi:hypothetical protein